MSSMTKQRQAGAVKGAVLRWLGLSPSDSWPIYGGANASGKNVTVDSALQLSAVWSCVRLLAETIATLPLGFYERMDDGSRRSATRHPIYALIHSQPNADMTAVEFWEVVVASMALRGNAFVHKTYSGGTVVSLDYLMPDRMSLRRLTDGRIEYRYTNLRGVSEVIPESEILHFRAFGTGGLLGISPIQAGSQVFGAAMAADEASAKVFANSMSVGGILYTDQILKPEQREALRTSLQQQFAGAMNAGKTFVAEAGMKYQQVPMNPEDAQLLETRSFNGQEICRWFRIPPTMVGYGEKTSNWGTGIEQQMIGFLTFSLRPWLARIEQGLRRGLLNPSERDRYFAEFSIEGLLRADSAARASFYSAAAQNGWMTRNEIRALENRLPIDGGDALTVQSNLLPIDRLGSQDPAGVAAGALKNWLLSHENDDEA